MSAITALLHTHNDSLRLGRALETLYPCDQILIVDHASQDHTAAIARQYGARILEPVPFPRMRSWVPPGWILCLSARESLTESLAASLYEVKLQPPEAATRPFSLRLREETAQGWADATTPETRLVPHVWDRWTAFLPHNDPSSLLLEGELLRFAFP